MSDTLPQTEDHPPQTGPKTEDLWPQTEDPRYHQEPGIDLTTVYTLFRSLHVNEEMMIDYDLIQLYRQNRKDYELINSIQNMGFRKKFCIRFVRLVSILTTFPSLDAFQEVWSSVAESIEEFLKLESTTKLDVLQVFSIIIFTVHLHKRMPVELELHFVLLEKYAVFVTFELAARLLQECASAQDVFSTPLLPALLAFLEWYVYSPDMITEKVETYASVVTNQHEERRISRARRIFFKCCQNFLKSTLSGKNIQGHDGILSSCRNNDELVDRVALWEDGVLQGYAPFEPVYCALKLSGPILCRADENKNRMARITDAVRKVVLICKPSKFQDKGDLKRQESHQSGTNRDAIGNFER